METKRVSTGGRRGNKKDAVNNGTKNAKRKGVEDANVLRTRSGRTRTTTSFNNAATSRKKTSNASLSKNSCMESVATKSTKEISSDITQQNVEGEIHISDIVQDDMVRGYSGWLFFVDCYYFYLFSIEQFLLELVFSFIHFYLKLGKGFLKENYSCYNYN